MNPYAPPCFPEQTPSKSWLNSLSLDWQVFLMVLVGLHPLICTILLRQTSLLVTIVGSITILVLPIFATSFEKLEFIRSDTKPMRHSLGEAALRTE